MLATQPAPAYIHTGFPTIREGYPGVHETSKKGFLREKIRMTPAKPCQFLRRTLRSSNTGEAGSEWGKRVTEGLFTAACQCSRISPKNRTNCGFPGISSDDCFSNGCCFDSTIRNVPWCFDPLPKQENQECIMEVSARVNCGFPGISSEECASRNCCFSDTIRQVPWCFYPLSVEEVAIVAYVCVCARSHTCESVCIRVATIHLVCSGYSSSNKVLHPEPASLANVSPNGPPVTLEIQGLSFQGEGGTSGTGFALKGGNFKKSLLEEEIWPHITSQDSYFEKGAAYGLKSQLHLYLAQHTHKLNKQWLLLEHGGSETLKPNDQWRHTLGSAVSLSVCPHGVVDMFLSQPGPATPKAKPQRALRHPQSLQGSGRDVADGQEDEAWCRGPSSGRPHRELNLAGS
ncbi:hypothetical protein HPG69_016103, partial [Diceros bicornis minor]